MNRISCKFDRTICMPVVLTCLYGAHDETDLMSWATTASQVAAWWLMNLDAALSLQRLQPCPLIDALHIKHYQKH